MGSHTSFSLLPQARLIVLYVVTARLSDITGKTTGPCTTNHSVRWISGHTANSEGVLSPHMNTLKLCTAPCTISSSLCSTKLTFSRACCSVSCRSRSRASLSSIHSVATAGLAQCPSAQSCLHVAMGALL